MSIVVAVKKGTDVALAADTQSSFGAGMVPADNHRASKIRKVGPVYVATTGWGIYDNILEEVFGGRRAPRLENSRDIFAFFLGLWRRLHERYPFVKDQCHKHDDSPFGDLDASFLVVNGRGIFYVASDMSVTRFDRYYAVGSGADLGMGAIHALYNRLDNVEEIARSAVEAAIALNTTCGGEIEARKLKARA